MPRKLTEKQLEALRKVREKLKKMSKGKKTKNEDKKRSGSAAPK